MASTKRRMAKLHKTLEPNAISMWQPSFINSQVRPNAGARVACTPFTQKNKVCPCSWPTSTCGVIRAMRVFRRRTQRFVSSGHCAGRGVPACERADAWGTHVRAGGLSGGHPFARSSAPVRPSMRLLDMHACMLGCVSVMRLQNWDWMRLEPRHGFMRWASVWMDQQQKLC